MIDDEPDEFDNGPDDKFYKGMGWGILGTVSLWVIIARIMKWV